MKRNMTRFFIFVLYDTLFTCIHLYIGTYELEGTWNTVNLWRIFPFIYYVCVCVCSGNGSRLVFSAIYIIYSSYNCIRAHHHTDVDDTKVVAGFSKTIIFIIGPGGLNKRISRIVYTLLLYRYIICGYANTHIIV
jgi:hypothetical protein